MEKKRQERIEANAMVAWFAASNNGYISRYSSSSEVIDNAYEILQYMPELDVDGLTDEEYDYALSVVLDQLC